MNRFVGKYIISLLVLSSLFFTQLTYQGSIVQALSGINTGDIRPESQMVPPNPDAYPDYYKKNEGNKDRTTQTTQVPQISPKKELTAAREMMPAAGETEKVLVIPISFTDANFTAEHNKAYFEGIMNSLKDYYEKNSGYDGTHGITVNATVTNVVQSIHTMAYYGADGTDIDNANGNVQEIAREAVQLLDAQGFDFTPYDVNQDGIIDHIIIIHAGDGQEEINNTNLIWSHHSQITRGGQTVDGKTALKYTLVPETGKLGVFAHEFGHDLGLPDLYDADDLTNGTTNGVGDWDIMGTGSWNHLPGEAPGTTPSNLSAWSRMYLGWITPIDISANDSYTITNTNGNSNVYRIWTDGNTSGNEYYLTEYRRKAGYDAGLPGEGLLVWHVDQQMINMTLASNMVNSYNGRLGLELEQADGNWDLWYMQNRGDAGDPFPGTSENRDFTAVPYGFNYSNITAGSFSYVEIRNISVSGSTATADYYVTTSYPTVAPVLNSPVNNSLVAVQPNFSWGLALQAKQYKLQIADDNAFTTNLKEITLSGIRDGLEYKDGKYFYTLPSDQTLDYGKTYYWRVAGINDSTTAGNTVWSGNESFTTMQSIASGGNIPDTPVNLQHSAETDNSITVTWNADAGATGYYILVDGVEFYTGTNTYTQNSLSSGTRHTYCVRTVNASDTSAWSPVLTDYTTGIPTIAADASSVVEGSEDGSTITVTLSNGNFRADGIYNKATVTLDPDSLPAGIKEGNITRVDGNTLHIQLVGDSTADYDSNIPVTLTVAKEEIDTGRYADPTTQVVFTATNEPTPAIPNVTFSFDGDNASKLMGITTDMEYSLDGGTIYFPALQSDLTLSQAQIACITADKDIKIRGVVAPRAPAGPIQTIDIQSGPPAPTVTGDDDSNTVAGIDNTMEFSTDGANWTKYNGSLPDLSGNVTLRVRIPAAGMTLPSSAATLTFAASLPPSPPPSSPPPISQNGGGGGFVPFIPPNISGSTQTVVEPPPPPEIKGGLEVDDSAIKAQVNNPDTKEIKVNIPSDAKEQSAVIDASVLNGLAENEKSLTIDSGKVDITLPPAAIDSGALKEAGTDAQVKIAVEQMDKDAVKDKLEGLGKDDEKGLLTVGNTVFDFTSEILSGDKTERISSFNTAIAVTISLDGVDLSNADVDKLGVYYFNETTKIWEYVGGKYNPETKSISFTTSHFSLYSVMQYVKTFADITNHWAKKDIESMAAKHIAQGKTEDTFEPDANITRAEFTAILVRALVLKDTAQKVTSFKDVKEDQWYSPEVNIALEAGIASKSDGSAFRPDINITREEMATMIVRALAIKVDGLSMDTNKVTEKLSCFSDSDRISNMAKQSVAIAVEKGIIHGRTPDTFAPRENATRAEAIVMIKRLLDLI